MFGNWNLFSKYRDKLMSLAILEVMVFHFFEDLYNQAGITSKPVSIIRNYGAFGVEMFLILSGIGLYYSFRKNPDIRSFYLKRLKGILIPYFLIAFPYLIWVDFIVEYRGIWIFLQDLCMITAFQSRNRVCWYIATFKRRTRMSQNRYYNILNISGLGVICCLLVQGNSDWAPLTPQVLNLSLMFIALSLNRHFAAEEHPEFESVEASKRHLIEASVEEQTEVDTTPQMA